MHTEFHLTAAAFNVHTFSSYVPAEQTTEWQNKQTRGRSEFYSIQPRQPPQPPPQQIEVNKQNVNQHSFSLLHNDKLQVQVLGPCGLPTHSSLHGFDPECPVQVQGIFSSELIVNSNGGFNYYSPANRHTQPNEVIKWNNVFPVRDDWTLGSRLTLGGCLLARTVMI